jgi:thioredoxin-like negative regulator of GroEL
MTVQALDAAAESARNRGAPAAAAELLELAMRLGADIPKRRIQTAAHHFDAGDLGRAQSLLEETVAQMPPGGHRAEALHTLALVRLYHDSFVEAASLLEQGLGEAGDNAMLERLDRAWMLAVGARCRSMLLAARGDVEAAIGAALQAMTEHDRLPMPFERARTQLLLGQLQRRQRHRDAAAQTLREALATLGPGREGCQHLHRKRLVHTDLPCGCGLGKGSDE